MKALESNLGSEKCGAWSIVQQNFFNLQWHVKRTKTVKTSFSFPKRKISYLTCKCSASYLTNQQNVRGKKIRFVWERKCKEIVGNVFCPKSGNEYCIHITTHRNTRKNFLECGKCRLSCHKLNVHFGENYPFLTLSVGEGTSCYSKKTSRDYEKEKSFAFSRKFSVNQNMSRAKLSREKPK